MQDLMLQLEKSGVDSILDVGLSKFTKGRNIKSLPTRIL